MSRLTTAFDEWLDILSDCYALVEWGDRPPAELVAMPGASSELLDRAESRLGYGLAPEVRELYAHANGVRLTGVNYWFAPGGVSFPPLEQTMHTCWACRSASL